MNTATNPQVAATLRQIESATRQGDVAGALALLAPLLAAHPDAAPVRRAAARAELARGDTSAAIAQMQAAARLQPDAATHVEYGCLLAHAGHLHDALDTFRAASALPGAGVDAAYFLGITLARLGRHAEALAPLRAARRAAPDNERVLAALCDAEFQAGFPEDALPLWRELAARRPGDLDVVLRLGETLSRLGLDDDAARWFRDALARAPDAAELWMALGQVEEDRGDRAAAVDAYEAALARRPGWAQALAALLTLQRRDAPPARVDEARQRLAAVTGDAERALLGYALGKVMDGRGAWTQAMADWDLANAARRRGNGEFDAALARRRAEETMARFDAAAFADAPPPASDDPRPVFIVGMPRSGTTLTEQIIAAHPRAFGAGELVELSLVAASLPAPGGGVLAWPPDPRALTREALDWAVARYLQAATRRAPADALRIVDKAPLNYHRLGLVARMFSQARVIWCRRDPRDVAVSIYGENFALDERSATTLAGIGTTIGLQERLMRHWQQVLPLPILEVRYEALVADFEPQVRRLLDFVGLPFDPACLDFHASDRGVQTPSRWQVRQPVHSRSVGRWRDYGFALGPLLDALPEPPAD